MKKLTLISIVALSMTSLMSAFEYTSGETKLEIEGYIKADTFLDSRRVVADRFGWYLLYPYKVDCDSRGKDINACGQYGMSLIESNVGATITGPKIWSATPTGVLTVSFYGNSEDTAYLPRIYPDGYVALDWLKDYLLFGQTEHPLASLKCSPRTISYNAGAPMQAQGVQPQLRYTHRFGKFRTTVCALTQVPDSLSNGPDGFSTVYLRKSKIPDTALMLEWENRQWLVSGVFDVKRLRPRTVNDFNERVDETITSMIGTLGLHYGTDKVEVNSKVFYAQNGVDQTLLGGYGVATRNAADERTYTNLTALSWWLDAHGSYRRWDIGCFFGIGKNLGADKNLYFDPETHEYIIYGLDVDADQIDTIIRLSPRVSYSREPFKIATELEYTGASFGTVQCDGTVNNARFANNIRLMLSAYFIF